MYDAQHVAIVNNINDNDNDNGNDNDNDKIFYSTLIIHFILMLLILMHIIIRYWVRRQTVMTHICHRHSLPTNIVRHIVLGKLTR